MKLSEALKTVQAISAVEREKKVFFLACGFMPLHLNAFLAAHLSTRLPTFNIEIKNGIYGDLAGNIELFQKSSIDSGVVMIEWADLDPRLGWRSLGGWSPKLLPDIRKTAQTSVERLFQILEKTAQSKSIIVSLPSLPLPPISYLPGAQSDLSELFLKNITQEFGIRLSAISNLKLLNQTRLDEAIPLSERFDIKSELTSGFPYRLTFADRVAELSADLLQPLPPKKGLISDLDDTLWRGILGEEGVNGVSWNLDSHSHIHALYQQLLSALAESGVLIGIASKNEHNLVEEALERDDLILPKKHLFPLEINWQQKSHSVNRILGAWNINADSVVFIDDSPIELAEVKAAHPEMECLLFPKNDDYAAYQLLEKLRPMFGKSAILEEDSIRAESLRRAQEFYEQSAADKSPQSLENFLENLNAELTFSSVTVEDSRAFELINKTNQFNLNGCRLSESEFKAVLNRANAVALAVSYKDKFGPLGKIAVLLGSVNNDVLKIDNWVMSCRAFSRHIEHQTLKYLFDKYGVSEIGLSFQTTARNEPTRQFLIQFVENSGSGSNSILRKTFEAKNPTLFHKIIEVNYV